MVLNLTLFDFRILTHTLKMFNQLCFAEGYSIIQVLYSSGYIYMILMCLFLVFLTLNQ